MFSNYQPSQPVIEFRRQPTVKPAGHGMGVTAASERKVMHQIPAEGCVSGRMTDW